MTDLLLQSALAASKTKLLATEAAQIRSNCVAQHHHHNRHHQEEDNNNQDDSNNKSDKPDSLVSCPECYASLLEAVRSYYLASTSPEWFTPRRAFLAALDDMFAQAKEYQLAPSAIDARVREERGRWYAEQVRGRLMRLLAVVDFAGREAVAARLEELASPSPPPSGDPARLATEIAGVLEEAGLLEPASERGGEAGRGIAEMVLNASDEAARAAVLTDLLFAPPPPPPPPPPEGEADQQTYLDMLVDQGLTVEQVVDRIVEKRQQVAGTKGQIAALSQRLDELRRARAAYELQKRRRESLAQQRVPDEVYELPACVVCGAEPMTRDFFNCTVCAILAGRGVREQQTVFCSRKCEEKGHASHAETHTCSSASRCIQLRQKPQTEGDTHMQEPSPGPGGLVFCTECLTSLRQPTMWCSLACAGDDFQRHREEVHLPERKKLSLDVDDEGQLKYSDLPGDGSERRYRAKDIHALTTTLDDAVGEWEERNHVRLQTLG
ncbi:hypothetical protein MFIFM68171_02394 [Madurella fahalii]|uniref:MYND-type domain-containing protein n=1 Tax=Madurella fahalii TaxID=1157608 RepID=A0ABQ0G356_9PEZI